MRSSPDAKTKAVISETVDSEYPKAYAKEDEKRMGNWKLWCLMDLVSCPPDDCQCVHRVFLILLFLVQSPKI